MSEKADSGKPNKRPSIRDVARHAGVSTATVSNVFSRKKNVNDQLAQRVQRAARTLGYSVNPIASQLRAGRTRAIAVIVPDLEDLFLTQIVSQIEARAHEAGYEVIISSTHSDPDIEASRLSALLSWRPAGIVFLPATGDLPHGMLEGIGETPIVAADRIRPGSHTFDTVVVNNLKAGQDTINHLMTKGAKSVLYVAASLKYHTIRERLRAAEIECDKTTDLSFNVLEIGPDPAKGAETLAAWFKANPLPDAVVGLTNVTTLSTLSAFAMVGIEAPRDILLVGYHDSLWMTARKSPVTTIEQPTADLAEAVWSRLHARMSGDEGDAQNIVLDTRLLTRTSTNRAL